MTIRRPFLLLLLLICSVVGFAAAPLRTALARRIGKHRALAAPALADAAFGALEDP